MDLRTYMAKLRIDINTVYVCWIRVYVCWIIGRGKQTVVFVHILCNEMAIFLLSSPSPPLLQSCFRSTMVIWSLSWDGMFISIYFIGFNSTNPTKFWSVSNQPGQILIGFNDSCFFPPYLMGLCIEPIPYCLILVLSYTQVMNCFGR